jgi:hypothetical protein
MPRPFHLAILGLLAILLTRSSRDWTNPPPRR